MLRHIPRRRLPSYFTTRTPRLSHISNSAFLRWNSATPSPSHTSPASARLDQVLEFLDTPKRLKYTSMDCLKLYEQENSSLVRDLLEFPDHKSLTIITNNFRKSKLLATFVLDQLCSVILERDTEEAIKFFKLLENGKLLEKGTIQNIYDLEKSTLDFLEIVSRLGALLITEKLRMGEPLVAALCALKLHKNEILVDSKSLISIISSLSVHAPQRLLYHSYTIVKLFKVFKEKDIPLQVKVDAISSMIGGPVVPYFANSTYDQIVSVEKFQNYSVRQLTKQLIEANLECGNLRRCVHLWSQANLANSEFAPENLGLFARLIDQLASENRNLALDLVKYHFPADLQKDPAVIDSFLSLYGQSKDHIRNFEELTHELKPPLLRKTLSLLFSSFLFQNNEKAAERILQVIFRTKNGLSAEDFQHIVQTLLRQQKIQQSVTMCNNTDISISKGAYVKTVDFFLSHTTQTLRPICDIKPEQFDKLKSEFLVQARRKLQILNAEDPALLDLTTSIFKYLSHHRNNKASRKLYIVHSSHDGHLQPFFPFQSHSLPDFNDLMYIAKGNRLTCLIIILNQAVSEKDRTTVQWAMDEMAAMGLSNQDIEELRKGD